MMDLPNVNWTAVSVAAAAIGLFLNAWSIAQATKTRQLQLFERIFNDIRSLDEKLQSAAASGATVTIIPGWRSVFLQTLEYLAFLVNKRLLKDCRLIDFFSGAVIHWYDSIFVAHASETEKTDPSVYPELKRLHTKLKKSQGSKLSRLRVFVRTWLPW